MNVFCLILLSIATLSIQAYSQKRLYIANDDHTDYMWTANEARYDSAFVHMLDYYIRQVDSTARGPGKTNPDDFQARFNCDGSYWLKTYQKHRSPAQFLRLVEHIESGHISSPLNSLVSVFGCQPAEAVLRGMFYAGSLERQYSLRFPMAIAMENQTLPMGLTSLWAGSGARWSWRGVCQCASRISNKRLSVRKNYLYYYTGPDGQRVLMKWYPHTRIGGGSQSLGGYGETRLLSGSDPYHNINPRIPELKALADSSAAHPFRVAGAFGYGSDDLETYVSPAFIKVAEANSTDDCRVRVSNEEDFFRDVEKTYPTLPAESVSYGNEWDLYPASMNETTAQVRRATERLRSAEALATLVSIKNSAFGADLVSAKNGAWDAFGKYWEHDWTADGPVSRRERADWQVKQKNHITGYVDTLYHRASVALGALIPAATHPRRYAFNPLSWIRSDVADFAYAGNLPVAVIDLADNREVANQVITKNGKTYLRIWAERVPPVGYKVYELRGRPTAKSNPKANAVFYKNGFLQNQFYRLRLLKSGAIDQLYDRIAGKQPGSREEPRERQLVKSENFRLLNDLGSTHHGQGSLMVENAGPVSLTVKAVSASPIPHTVRVTLFAHSPRIEIEDSIQANFGDVKKWTFSFGLTKPTTHFEEIGAILTARKTARGGHYSSENARYDWLTFNHFADLSEADYGVTLSNQDCNFFQLGESTADSLWEDSPQVHALAGGQIDGRALGIHDQHGETRFRYNFALTMHQAAFSPKEAMKFSLEHQNPLTTAPVTGTPTANGYPAMSYSFLSISDPGQSADAVLLWSLKPAEEGIDKGVIARFWNVSSSLAKPTVNTQRQLRDVWKTSHIETDEKQVPFDTNRWRPHFSTQQMTTYRLLYALD